MNFFLVYGSFKVNSTCVYYATYVAHTHIAIVILLPYRKMVMDLKSQQADALNQQNESNRK